jgi:hypothetical protein
MNGHVKQRSFSTMQILFNKTLEQCRQLGARGGRAYGRNLLPPPIPGSRTDGGPTSRATLGNRPPGQFAPGRAISLAGLRSPPDPPRPLMPRGQEYLSSVWASTWDGKRALLLYVTVVVGTRHVRRIQVHQINSSGIKPENVRPFYGGFLTTVKNNAVERFHLFQKMLFHSQAQIAATKVGYMASEFFTPEVRFYTHYMTDFNQPKDHTSKLLDHQNVSRNATCI